MANVIMNNKEFKNILECLLFTADKPLTLYNLNTIVQTTPKVIEELITELKNDYEERGLQIQELAGGYQLSTKPEYAVYIQKLKSSRTFSLSRPALETLAIVAYKQPVTKIEIESLRRVDVVGVLQTLLEKKLIRITGRKQTPGRPFLYGTTYEFLKHLGLKGLEDLPKIKEDEK